MSGPIRSPTDRRSPAAAHAPLLCLWLWSGATAAAPTLTLTGLPDEDARWLRQNVSVPDCVARGWPAGRFADTLRSRIRARRRSVGDYEPFLNVTRTVEDGCVRFTVDVRPGPTALVGQRRIDVRGPGAPAVRAALAPSDLLEGGPFREGAYESLKSRLLGAALDAGYFDAALVTNRVTVRPDSGPDGAPLADVDLVIETGPRFRIRAVRIEVDGPRPPEARLRRYVRLRSGDVWDREQLDTTRRALLASGYVADLVLRPEPVPDDADRVDVVIEVDPIRRYETSAGIGYSTDTGAGVNGAFSDRLSGPGTHRWEIRGAVAERERNGAVVYGFPARDRDTVWGLEAGGGLTITDTSEEVRWGAGARRHTELSGTLDRTLHLELTASDFAIGDDPQRFAQFLVAGARWNLERTDGAERLPQGLRASLDLSAASAALLSDADLIHARARIEGAWRSDPRTRVRARLELGALDTDDFEALPPTWRFFAGGDDSVRGFDREALGPQLDGEVRGGRYLVTGSLELERIVWRNWGAAVFTDAGNAFDETGEADPELTAGLGLRWFSPVGAVRADVAVPVGGGDPRLHLTVGRTF